MLMIHYTFFLLLCAIVGSNKTDDSMKARNMASYTFAVAPVNKTGGEKDLPKAVSLNEVANRINEYWKRTNPNSPSLEFWSGQTNFSPLRATMPNAFLGTIVEAYNRHLPLVLSPDDFWLLISIGVSQFISNPKWTEKYRHTFVEHEGKEQLRVEFERPNLNDTKVWTKFVAEIADEIANRTKSTIAEDMTKSFSTTGIIESTAFKISLMETMKGYFEYVFVLACGIPEITLEGTEEDYVSIVARIDRLATILPDFAWYLRRVEAIMRKVLDTRRGHPDTDWWRTMVSHRMEGSGGSGTPFHFGWIAQFFPYRFDENNKPLENKNQEAQRRRVRDNVDEFVGLGDRPVVTLTPVTLEDQIRGEISNLTLVGGFIGTAAIHGKYTNTTVALRPAIGWMIFNGPN